MKKILSALLISLLVLTVLSIYIDYRGLGGETVTVVVPVGTGATEIAKTLQKNNVIGIPFLFLKYIGNDTDTLRAGVHTFTKRMGYARTLEELKRDVPLENSISVTVPEGYEMREIGILLENVGIITAAEFSDACKTACDRYNFLPDNGNTEGYLFPATYTFQKGCSAEAVVDKMIQTFSDKMLTEENVTRAEELGMTFHEALTLASIVEREAALSEERPIISSVFHNRLKANMKLESCATVQYILKERKPVLQIADTKIDSVYNTYLHQGLPPAPIASPGEASLYAALYPASTEYLFFVSDENGGHTFSLSFSEHLAAASSR